MARSFSSPTPIITGVSLADPNTNSALGSGGMGAMLLGGYVTWPRQRHSNECMDMKKRKVIKIYVHSLRIIGPSSTLLTETFLAVVLNEIIFF